MEIKEYLEQAKGIISLKQIEEIERAITDEYKIPGPDLLEKWKKKTPNAEQILIARRRISKKRLFVHN